jgi:hypothetical protein
MPKKEVKKNIDSVEPATEQINSAIEQTNSFLKTGTEDFNKREKPETHNSESDDEPCCSKHIQRKREWQHEREILLARCKATENSQQVLRNVRGILEQLRKRYFFQSLHYISETNYVYNKFEHNHNYWQERS